jgi:hypothetical protein
MTQEPTVLGHSRGHACPRCAAAAYCDDCALCETCGFVAPNVDLTQPAPPAPKTNHCRTCGATSAHTRMCPVTLVLAIEP